MNASRVTSVSCTLPSAATSKRKVLRLKEEAPSAYVHWKYAPSPARRAGGFGGADAIQASIWAAVAWGGMG